MSHKPVLVIMAAGMGSRYGGLKQLDPVGSHGQLIIDYSIYDAKRAGFETVVFVIKPEIEADFKEAIGDRVSKVMDVKYAYQLKEDLPEGYSVPAGRTKPWGTAHAALAARNIVDGPFAVINADDYYGPEAYQEIYNYLSTHQDGDMYEYVMVGYLLKNTASLHGTVTRGICVQQDGFLRGVRETRNIQLYPDGTLRDLGADRPLDPDAVVSMNFWGFMPSIFPILRRDFEDFLRTAGDDLRAERLLPEMVDSQLREGGLRVSLLSSASQWFGMTYREDREAVAQALRRLHERGEYPESLRS